MGAERGPTATGQASEFIPFEVVSEPWSRYELSDATLLRVRFVLLRLVRAPSQDPQRPHGATMNSQVLIAVEPPPQFRGGKPGPPLGPGQIEKTLGDDLAVTVVSDAPSVYRFEEDRKLVVNTRVVKVQRSSESGPDGDRLYWVGTQSEVAVLGGPSPGQALQPPPRIRDGTGR